MANDGPRVTGDRFDYEGCGQEVQVEYIKAYDCKPPASTGKALIVIHDMLGRQLPNTRYMADMLTSNGYMNESFSSPRNPVLYGF